MAQARDAGPPPTDARQGARPAVDAGTSARRPPDALDAGPDVALNMAGLLADVESRLAASEKETADAKSEAARLRADLERLKAKMAQFEQRASQETSKSDELGGKIDRLSQSVLDIKAIVAAEAARQEQTQAAAADLQARTQAAVNALATADDALSRGSTGDATAAMQQASTAFTGLAATYLQLARKALDNGDLANARLYLRAASQAAQAPR
jgi:chromosome segregation ATPase